MKLLPLLIGDVIPKDAEHWKFLCGIVDIIISPWSSIDLTAILTNQIRNHHQAFISLYTESAIIPKFPNQILNVGPMVRTWNMRNEAKLNVM